MLLIVSDILITKDSGKNRASFPSDTNSGNLWKHTQTESSGNKQAQTEQILEALWIALVFRIIKLYV